MTYDKFWMSLHRLGYAVKWEPDYVLVKKNGELLATIDRWAEYSYELHACETECLNDNAFMLITSLASTPVDKRWDVFKWEIVNDKRTT